MTPTKDRPPQSPYLDSSAVSTPRLPKIPLDKTTTQFDGSGKTPYGVPGVTPPRPFVNSPPVATKLEGAKVKESSIPLVYVSRVSLTDNNNSLTVGYNFNLKAEVKKGNALGDTWASNDMFRSNFRVITIMVTDKKEYQSLKSLPKARLASTLWANRAHYSGMEITAITEDYQKKITDLEMVMTKDQNSLYTIPFRNQRPFSVEDLQPEHLSLFFIPYIQRNSDKTPRFGRVKIERVIDNSTTVKTGTVFRLPTGEIWKGPVHRHPGKPNVFMAGAMHTSTPHPELIVDTVYNSTIQDYRILSELQKQKDNFAGVNQNKRLKNNPTNLLTRDNFPGLEKKPTFFSDLFVSRDHAGNSRFFFSIDALSAARRASAFPGLFENSNLTADLVKRAKILSFRVVRKRIQSETGFNKFGFKSSTDFASEEEERMICHSADENGSLKTQTYIEYPGKGIEEKVGFIKEVRLRANQQNVRNFTGVDLEMKGITGGLYQYGVRMEILDPTVSYLNQKLAELTDAIATIENYKAEADGINPIAKKNNYDPYNERFIPEFRSQTTATPSQLRTAIASYLQINSLVSEGQLTSEFTGEQFYNMIAPQNGTLDGIIFLLNTMQTLISQLQTALDATISGPVLKPTMNGGSAGPSRNKASSAIRTEKLSKDFSEISEIFNSDVAKAAGYDFLSTRPTESSVGVHEMKYTDFLERATQELLKYFKSPQAFSVSKKTIDTSKTNLSFLSPLQIGFNPNRKHEIENNGRKFYDTTPYNSIISDILRYNSNRDIDKEPFNTSPNSELSANTQFLRGRLLDFFAGKGCTVTNIQAFQDPESVDGTLDSIMDKNDDLVDTVTRSEKIQLSQNTAYEKSIVNPNEVLFRLIENAVTPQGFDGMQTDLYDLGSEHNIFDQLDQSIIDAFPLHVKALISGFTLTKEESDRIMNVDLNQYKEGDCKCNFGFLYENFLNIMQVETLVGYETTTDGQIQIKSPIFQLASENTLGSARPNELSFCRLKRYTNVTANVPVIDSLSFPVYNETFLISYDEPSTILTAPTVARTPTPTVARTPTPTVVRTPATGEGY